MHRPRDESSKGRIVQGTCRPRDASSNGRIIKGALSPGDQKSQTELRDTLFRDASPHHRCHLRRSQELTVSKQNINQTARLVYKGISCANTGECVQNHCYNSPPRVPGYLGLRICSCSYKIFSAMGTYATNLVHSFASTFFCCH
jgi:hypothetical protein